MTDKTNRLSLQMSLRTPQAESLRILSDILGKLQLSKTPDNAGALATINEIETPRKLHIKDFGRDFPSLCFSLATGVGKTRLMGAFIAYMYTELGIKNFFIVAPNLTVYNKLIADFTPNTPKYVFKGVLEFAVKRPLITTGDNYKDGLSATRMYDDVAKINIFNISKINRDKDSKGTPQFKRTSEIFGESYFEYLQSLPDLVLLMDEAHRYRATAGMKVINELNPVLGLELTATAKTTGANAKDLKNIIYHYSLANAIQDKYVKKPTIIGRSDFNTYKDKYTAEQQEEIKLSDGFKIHEDTKVDLAVYASEHNRPYVKPFLLIIARDTEHADALKAKIDSDDFNGGAYKGKVLVIHSNQKETELDENIALLLEVEKPTNPIEVVIHVNMLAEGWDVNNLYTIVPLKAARTDILVEQSIGRGLRLPYGAHTGVDAIDRLNIVAHDKFNEIVDTAAKEGFSFQQRIIDDDADAGKKILVAAPSSLRALIEQAEIVPTGTTAAAPVAPAKEQTQMPLTFANATEKKAALEINDMLEDMGKIVSSADELKSKEMQTRLVDEYIQREKDKGNMFAEQEAQRLVDAGVFKKTTERFVEHTIDVPKVDIYMAFPKTSVEYKRFDLDLTPFGGLKPVQQQIIRRELLDNKAERVGEAEFVDWKGATENPIISELMNNQAIPFDIVGTLRFFAEQVTNHIRTYAADEMEVRKIVFYNDKIIAHDIFEQMRHNIVEPEMQEIVKVSGGCAQFRSTTLAGNVDDGELDYRVQPKALSRIRNIVFNGFEKALSSKTKFDSDTERQLSVILESEPSVVRWERILSAEAAQDIIRIQYYSEDRIPRRYVPDFIVETTDGKYIVETKAEDQMTAKDVTAKRNAANRWCAEATKYEQSVGGKPWKYVLIPHTELVADRSWDKLIADWTVK